MTAFLLAFVVVMPFFFIRYQITNPFGYLSFFIGIFFLLKYFHHLFFDYEFLDSIEADDISHAFVFMAIYLLIAFSIALLILSLGNIRSIKTYNNNSKVIRDFIPTNSSLVALIFTPVGLLLYGLNNGISPFENPLLFRQLIQGKGMFYFLSLQLFLSSVYAVYVPYSLITLRKSPGKFILIGYLFSIGFAILSGFSSMLLIFLISPLFFYSICYRKKVEHYIFFGIPVVLLYVLIYSAFRDARLSFSEISLSDALNTILSNVEISKYAFNRFDYLEMYTRGWIFIENNSPDYGLSLFNFLFQAIPRSIWNEKPNNFSTLMTIKLLPQNFDIGVTANFNSLNEFGYSFGGNIGVILGGIFLGLILAVGYIKFLLSAFSPYNSLHYLTVIFPYVTAGFMGGFINDLPLPILILNFLYFHIFVNIRLTNNITKV